MGWRFFLVIGIIVAILNVQLLFVPGWQIANCLGILLGVADVVVALALRSNEA